jgi:tellurite resistance protein
MKFNLLEKIAILKAVDEVLQMDQKIKLGEVNFLDKFATSIDFDLNDLKEVRKIEPAEAIAVLKVMPKPKKQALGRIMTQAANADGEVDEREIQFIYRIFSAAGIDP